MGVESGGRGGRVPRSRKISGGRPPPRNEDISVSFSYHARQFCIFQYFQNKVAEIRGGEEKLYFGLGGLGCQ